MQKRKIEENLMQDFLANLPNQNLTISSGLALLNGLAIFYKKAINDFSQMDKVVLDTKMKDVIFAKYLEILSGNDIDFQENFDEYISLLPVDFSSLIVRDIFVGKLSKNRVENELARLAYCVLELAVKNNIKQEKSDYPSLSNLNGALAEYKTTKEVLNRWKFLKNGNSDYEKDLHNYVNQLAKRIIENQVDYCDELCDYIERFYSEIEIARENEARERKYYDTFALGSEDYERGL